MSIRSHSQRLDVSVQSFRTLEGEVLTLLRVLDLRMTEIFGLVSALGSSASKAACIKNKTSRFVGMSARELVGMALSKSAKWLKTLVGAQGLEPWTR